MLQALHELHQEVGLLLEQIVGQSNQIAGEVW